MKNVGQQDYSVFFPLLIQGNNQQYNYIFVATCVYIVTPNPRGITLGEIIVFSLKDILNFSSLNHVVRSMVCIASFNNISVISWP